MIFPYSTDAPLYHWPIVTVGLIITNIVLFCLTTLQFLLGNLEVEQIQWLTIQYDQINPLQWLTGNFMHADPFTLIINMFFLFTFGLIVEGKIGNKLFLAIYLGICIACGAFAQVPVFLLGVEGIALGSSGVIFALMVIALVWAPENEIDCILIFFVISKVEWRIQSFGILFVGFQLIFLIMVGFSAPGALQDFCGIVLGTITAFHLLRTDGVDCEGWDVVSRNDWMKEYAFFYSEKQRARDREVAKVNNDPVGRALEVTGGDLEKTEALGLMTDMRRKKPKRAPSNAANTRTRKRKKRPDTIDVIIQKCQAHPEFNRLRFVLRQAMQSQNLHAARDAFLKLDSLKIAMGLNDETLIQYANALAQQQQWVDSMRPLGVVVEKKGELADDACLKLAQVQLRILKRSDLAQATLNKIVVSEGEQIDAAKREKLAKRDQLLEMAARLG